MERNVKNFVGCERSAFDLMMRMRTLFKGLLAFGKFFFSNLMEFIEYCSFNHSCICIQHTTCGLDDFFFRK